MILRTAPNCAELRQNRLARFSRTAPKGGVKIFISYPPRRTSRTGAGTHLNCAEKNGAHLRGAE